MMHEERYPADIRMESWAEGEERAVRSLSGTIYRKPGGWYLRYEDRDETFGTTMTTVKIAPGELKLIRRGAVESEMIFAPGRRRSGTMRTALFTMNFEVRCTEIRVDLHEGRGTVSWAYELRMEGGQPERRRIKISVS